jgi:broad specificity phosphatase PhoE
VVLFEPPFRFEVVNLQTVIGLFRHGQTDWNVDMRLQGISDIPLNDSGIQQVEVAAKALVNTNWNRLLSSPLDRARKSAEILNATLKMESAEIHELLIERSFGVAEGLSYDLWRDKYSSGEHADGSESLTDLTARAQMLLADLVTRYPGERVLTVSHGALIRRIINLVSEGELPRDGERFGNASLTTIIHDGDTWSIESFRPETLV